MIQGFSLPFFTVYLDFLLSISVFLPLTEVPLWCNNHIFENFTLAIRDGQFDVQPVEQLAHF